MVEEEDDPSRYASTTNYDFVEVASKKCRNCNVCAGGSEDVWWGLSKCFGFSHKNCKQLFKATSSTSRELESSLIILVDASDRLLRPPSFVHLQLLLNSTSKYRDFRKRQ